MNLSEFHKVLGAEFTTVDGTQVVAQYGDKSAEHAALHTTAGILDLSFRSRVCLTGGDRVRFLHGQVTNDIKRLRAGEGCYAALVTAKGRMESDLNVFCLAEELLLDFEPGLGERVTGRLEKYLVADDVQVVDVSALYGLLSVQGPKAEEVVVRSGIEILPAAPFQSARIQDPKLGEIYVANRPRLQRAGFDLFVPAEGMQATMERLLSAGRDCGARACGWQAFELARIEAGLPRFGLDMDESNFPQECGIEAQAVSYSKGCYIGQEVLNRIHTMGHVNRRLCRLRFADSLKLLPAKGSKLYRGDQEVGSTTSAAFSPDSKQNIGLGYVRKEITGPGAELFLRTEAGESPVQVGEDVGAKA